MVLDLWGFALMTIASTWLVKKVNVLSLFNAAIATVFIHWIVTDFGVWLGSSMYAQTLSGYMLCLVAAIPFEYNLFAGTVVYSAILFGCFEWMQKKYAVLARPNAG